MSFLDGLHILDSLNPEEKKNLELFCQEKHIAKDEYLFKEGEEATAMYILKKGSFVIKKYTEGTDKILGQVQAEEMLGEMALFGESGKRMASAQALEDAELVTILHFSIKELTNKNPELLEKIRAIIETRNMQNKVS